MTKEEFQLKKMALVVKGIFASACLSLGVAAVLYSASPVQANEGPALSDFVKTNQTTSSGKYRMQYVTGLNKSGDFYWHMMTYNTETAKMNLFYWDRKGQQWKMNFNGQQLPKLP